MRKRKPMDPGPLGVNVVIDGVKGMLWVIGILAVVCLVLLVALVWVVAQ